MSELTKIEVLCEYGYETYEEESNEGRYYKATEADALIAKLKLENHELGQKLHGAHETLAIKAKSLAHWQNQFSAMSGVETQTVADRLLKLEADLKQAKELLNPRMWGE